MFAARDQLEVLMEMGVAESTPSDGKETLEMVVEMTAEPIGSNGEFDAAE